MTTDGDALSMTRALARAAGLDLSPERIAYLAPRLARFREFLKPARDLPLGVTEPAFITRDEL